MLHSRCIWTMPVWICCIRDGTSEMLKEVSFHRPENTSVKKLSPPLAIVAESPFRRLLPSHGASPRSCISSPNGDRPLL
jgi:hypothetical protein